MENDAKKYELKVMLQEAAILAVITIVAGMLLGFVHEQTREPIRVQKELAVQRACRAVFPEENDAVFEKLQLVPSLELSTTLADNGVTIGTVFRAQRADGTGLGYVIETTSAEGYGGNIVSYVGITDEGVLNNVSILSISETPGLGMQAEKVLVPQFRNKAVTEFFYTKTGAQQENEIDAISGATITTRAMTNAVNGALKCFAEWKGGAENE